MLTRKSGICQLLMLSKFLQALTGHESIGVT